MLDNYLIYYRTYISIARMVEKIVGEIDKYYTTKFDKVRHGFQCKCFHLLYTVDIWVLLVLLVNISLIDLYVYTIFS